MWFGELKTEDCVACILAHSLKVSGKKISKGTLLDHSMVKELSEHGYDSLTVARLEESDIPEDEAATRLSIAVCGSGVRVETAHTGRVNLYAACDGLFVFDRDSIIAINSVTESITLSVIAENQWVLAGRMIGTAKIIPYGVAQEDLTKAISYASDLMVCKPHAKRAVLIQTTFSAIKTSTLDKTAKTTAQRLQARSSDLIKELRCDHAIDNVADALATAGSLQPDLVLIVGASAISDRFDVLPSAVMRCKGHVQRVGIPVDPGNLLMLAELGGMPVVGMPGCARSVKHNGLDLLLDRIICDIEITDAWLNSLCIGGLLGEMHDRPQPRVVATPGNRVAALVLAAGSSKRAGETNKLLYPFKDKTLVGAVIETVLKSSVMTSLVVTGHQRERVEEAIKQYDIEVCHSVKYSSGMAHSLAMGISRLQTYDAVLVCLADMPHVSTDVINKIVASADGAKNKIVVPVYNQQRGNPVLIGRTFFDSLLQHEGDSGARYLIQQYPDQVIEVEVDTDSVLRDYDTAVALQSIDKE